MNTPIRLLALACLLALATATTRIARAQEQSLEDRIDRLVQPYLDNEIVVGMSIGVWKDGESSVFGYGRTAVEGPARRPDGDTVYEIGSVTKVFTGILLGDAVAREELRLEQPIQSLLPDDVEIRPKDDQPIQLWHLATHTSGLPRLPDNLKPADPANPYADYTVEQLQEFLTKHELRRVPEEKSEYSNLGMGLLGHLLARQAEMEYESLLRQRLIEPLGLSSTAIQLTDSMKERLAPPHYADATPGHTWDIATLSGAGAIRSTVADLLKFAAAQIDPPAGRLGKAIELAWKPHYEPEAGQGFAMGLGWHIARDGTTRWHNGQTGGYHASVFVHRPEKTAVVLLTNTATGEVDRLAEDVLVMLLGGSVKPREFNKTTVDVKPEIMQRYVGKYQLAPTFFLTLAIKDGRLMAQATNQPEFQLFAKSEKEWFYKVVEASITFQIDDDGNCQGLVLHQGGLKIPGKRVEADSP